MTVRCYNSAAKMAGLFLLGLLMVGASAFCVTMPGLVPRIAGWLGIVFFGACSVAILVRSLRTDPIVVVDEVGIHDSQGWGTIPWNDVTGLSIGKVNSAKFLCVEVEDAEEYLSRLTRLKKMMARSNSSLGFPPITISFSGLSPGLDEVWDHLLKHFAAALEGRGEDVS